MSQSKEQDEVIGKDVFQQLHRLTERLAKRHGIPLSRAADYLMAGSLFTAAHVSGLTLNETFEVFEEIYASVQQDELPMETRH